MSSGGTKAFFCFTFYITAQNLCSKVWIKLYKHISVTAQNTDGRHTNHPYTLILNEENVRFLASVHPVKRPDTTTLL